jgi:hypothetical protein
MSEVVVRMEKFPTKCIDCKMWSICEALNKAMADDQDLFASRLFHKTEHGFTKPADCPIKGVLPDEHGDLVDRDEVKQKMIHYGFRAIDMTATEFCEDELQTVIAAERKDDEQTGSNTPS